VDKEPTAPCQVPNYVESEVGTLILHRVRGVGGLRHSTKVPAQSIENGVKPVTRYKAL
jgi:hypothetical protein